MNIVFAFGDDFGRYASCYKQFEGENSINHIVSTPNFDRIAQEGALFTNAFAPAPSCTPCRSSVLSGKYFWQTGLGAILQGAHWDDSIPTYPLELEKNGYHIGYTYKVWSPGQVVNAPYGGERTDYYKGDFLSYRAEGKREFKSYGNFGFFSQNVTNLSEKMSINEAVDSVCKEVKDSFTEFLSKSDEKQPFAYWWGPVNTHRPWQKGSGKKIWGLEPDDLKGRLPACLPDTPEVREDFCDYLGECQAFDKGLGILLDELEKTGELDDTLVVVSGDHGIPGMPRGKCNLYDLGTEVALAMMWPKKIKKGQVIDDMVNIMDLASTFLEAANVKKPESMTAKSLLSLVSNDYKNDCAKRDYVVLGRERHVAVAREGRLPYPQRSIRTKDYLYIINFKPDRWPIGTPNGLETGKYTYEMLIENGRLVYRDMDPSPTKAFICYNWNDPYINSYYKLAFYKRPYEELYKISSSDGNVTNLADNPKYKTIKEKLKEKLLHLLKEENDPRITEKDCCFDLSPFTD